MFAPPELCALEPPRFGTAAERRRRAFTVFCTRGIVVGSKPAVYTTIPSNGWLDRSAFVDWLTRPDVSEMRERDHGPDRLWTNGTPYGSWMDVNEFHVWNYDLHVDQFLVKIDALALKAESDLPPYSAVVALLRDWQVPKTLIAERGQSYDERRAARKDGTAKSRESAETREKRLSKAKSTEPALPILGGALSSLHVASTLSTRLLTTARADNVSLSGPCPLWARPVTF